LTWVIFPGERFQLRLIYDCRRYRKGTAQLLLAQMRVLLESMLARPESRLGELECISAEQHAKLRAWNTTTCAIPEPDSLHAAFERHARERPTSTALVFEGEVMSYSELNARANQLADTLRTRGVGVDDCVGVMLPRSPELVIAVLAIL